MKTLFFSQKYSFCVLLFFTSVMVSAQQIDLQSYSSGFDSIPVAVVEFKSLNNIPITKNHPWKIIADDLRFSGRFNVITAADVDSALFAQKNIGIYFAGDYYIDNDIIILDCYLYDATKKTVLVGKKYRGELKYLRQMVHRYTNLVYEMLLGERGPFESRILFVQDKGRTKNLVVMDYDGFNVQKVTQDGRVHIFPAFLDSNTIICTSFLRGKPDLYLVPIATGSPSIFVYSRFIDTSPSVSTVVDKVAFASSRKGNLDVYVCDSRGNNSRRLTYNSGIDTSPCWSPNGYHIAFTSDRSGSPQIYVMDADGANTKRVTFEGSYQDSPAWSPRGDKIAYSSLRNYKFDVWIVNPDGTQAQQVTQGLGNNEYPTWSPDGSHIAFVSTRGGKSDIYYIKPDGTGLRQITHSGNAKMPDWSTFSF